MRRGKRRILSIITTAAVIAAFVFSPVSSSFDVLAASSYGWNKDTVGWWYKDSDGSYPYDCWRKIEGYWYLFDSNGYMLTGWQKVDGEWYYMDSYGHMKTGWLKFGNDYYYLRTNGTMATDQWIGDDYVDKNGIWTDSRIGESTNGFVYHEGEWYYYHDGVAHKGWLNVGGGNWYYFYKDGEEGKTPGTMATDIVVDGWYVTPTGIANEATLTAKQIVDSNGGTLRAAYDYSSSLSYSGRTEYVESWGSGALANQGFKNNTGNCYVMAATFYCQALCLGYNAHQISGYVPSTRGGLTPHSWVELDEADGTWVYDPNRTMETGVDAYRKYYTEPGTWVYSNYHRMN